MKYLDEYSYVDDDVKRFLSEATIKWHKHLAMLNIFPIFIEKDNLDYAAKVCKTSKTGNLYASIGTCITGSIEEKPAVLVDVLLIINKDAWIVMTDEQKLACIDHELTHVHVDEDSGKVSLLPHDVEEFASVIERHGLWREELKMMNKAVNRNRQVEGADEGVDE